MHYKYAGSERSDKDKELIRRIQLYDDKMAMKELTAGCQGMLRKAIVASAVTSTGMDMNTAMNYAEQYLKRYAKTYDESTGNQPNTYLTTNITRQLINVKNNQAEGISHMSDELSEVRNFDRGATKWLERMDIEPTSDNTFDFIKNVFNKGKAELSPKKIDRARSLSRNEYSADRVVGSQEGADTITFGEVFTPTTDKTGEKLFDDYQSKQKIKTILEDRDFSRGERKFIRQLAGIDEFALSPTANKNQAALNAGISYSQGIAAIKKLQIKMKG